MSARIQSLFHITDDLLWIIGQEAQAKKNYNKVVADVKDLRKTMVIVENAITSTQVRPGGSRARCQRSKQYYTTMKADLFECFMVPRVAYYDDFDNEGNWGTERIEYPYYKLMDEFTNTLGDADDLL